jgi:hypothetical protein
MAGTRCAMPGCDSEQEPRVCGVAEGVDLSTGCGARFHHACSTRVLKISKPDEDCGGWDVCLECWLKLCERGDEIGPVLAAAAGNSTVEVLEVDLSHEEAEAAGTTKSGGGASSRLSLVSDSDFSGGVFNLSPSELAVLRGRPFYNKLQALERNRKAAVYRMYRYGQLECRAPRLLSAPHTRLLKPGPLDNATVIALFFCKA